MPSSIPSSLSEFQAMQERVRATRVSRAEVVERLAAQAVPVQVRKLKKFGRRFDILHAITLDPAAALRGESVSDLKAELEKIGGSEASCLEKTELIDNLVKASASADELAASWSQRLGDD